MTAIGNLFADFLRPRWITGLNKVSVPGPGVEPWLLSGTYSWHSSLAGTLNLDVSTAHERLAEAMAGEIARFSCAAYESLLATGSHTHDPRSLGWPLVRYYYASFYTAHALLRLSGTGVNMFSGQTASFLNQIGGQYLGMPPRISQGLHIVKVDRANPSIVQVTKMGSGAGGSHEEMWKLFLNLIQDLEDEITLTLGGAQQAQNTVQLLSKLRNHLCRQGKSGAWPSTVRNNINYRHDYGVWYPYNKLKPKTGTKLIARMTRWAPRDPDGFEIGQSSEDLTCFIDACNVMVQLLTAALSDVARRTNREKSSFVDRLPFKLLRLNRVAV